MSIDGDECSEASRRGVERAGVANRAEQSPTGVQVVTRDACDACDAFFHMGAHRDDERLDHVGKTRHTCHQDQGYTQKHQALLEVAETKAGDAFGTQPVTNASHPSPRSSASNERPPPSTPRDDLLVRLREMAPKLHVDAAGNLAGFGTLAHWPEGLLDQLEHRRDEIRDALLAERRVTGDGPPERDVDGVATKREGPSL